MSEAEAIVEAGERIADAIASGLIIAAFIRGFLNK